MANIAFSDDRDLSTTGVLSEQPHTRSQMNRLILLLAIATTPALGQIFYDGSLGTPMSAQNWLYSAETVPPGGSPGATTSFSGGATITDTTPVATDRAGWNIGRQTYGSFPVLDRTTGYSITIDLDLGSESHSNNDRAGLNWLTIGSDGFGVELGFWNDSIWAQSSSPLFNRAENVSVDPTSRTTYTLNVLGSTYTLSNSGGEILTGSLRNYGGSGAPLIPYGLARNYVFLGDNTSQAASQFSVYSVAVAVPEPGEWAAIAAALVLPAAVWLRRRNA